ncbi:MAG: nuclear transport factor 2 family protein [Myxococcota bacterium]
MILYRWFVERTIRRAFAALNRGDTGPILAGFAYPVEHGFSGDHALGGVRTTRATVEAWYARLRRVFPDLRFELDAVVVRGAPWATVAACSWTDRFTLPDGRIDGNRGVHLLHLRWGRVTRLWVHCDTDRLVRLLGEIRDLGVTDAGLPPISDR